MKMYALVTYDGTAAAETALTEVEYAQPEMRERIEKRAGKDIDLAAGWHDVTDNEAINPQGPDEI